MNNVEVIKALKLINSINIDFNKYNPTKVFIDLNNFEVFFNKNKLLTNIGLKFVLLKLFRKITILNIDFAH